MVNHSSSYVRPREWMSRTELFNGASCHSSAHITSSIVWLLNFRTGAPLAEAQNVRTALYFAKKSRHLGRSMVFLQNTSLGHWSRQNLSQRVRNCLLAPTQWGNWGNRGRLPPRPKGFEGISPSRPRVILLCQLLNSKMYFTQRVGFDGSMAMEIPRVLDGCEDED